MSEADADKWNAKYAEGAYSGRTYPSALVAEWLPRIKSDLTDKACPLVALDVACGAGRNSIYLAENGFEVTGVDISDTGLARAAASAQAAGVDVTWIAQDLDSGLPGELEKYSLILMLRYVDLALLARLPDLLIDGGVIICEEHLQTDASVAGPRSAAFRVPEGAVAEAVAGLELLYEDEGLRTDPDGAAVATARIVARTR